MISNQNLQITIDGLKSITKMEFTVLDTEGTVLVTTEALKNSSLSTLIPSFLSSEADNMHGMGYQLIKVYDNQEEAYIVAVKGDGDDAYTFARVAAFQIQTLLGASVEKLDKDSFIKNLLMDNLLLVDIHTRAAKLRIENNVPRLVYLVETNNDSDTNTNVMDVIRSLFPNKQKDFITAVDEHNIILVKETDENETRESMEKTAMTISDTLSSEAMGRVRVAIGSVVQDLKDVSRSYKEAKIALEVGKIFYESNVCINYNRLGIGRLIYQLPLPLCRMYLDEIFRDIRVDDFDEETLNTVNKFFENSLNISETSRQLYIHRNTLVYRLDKLQKTTGLDIRTFEDAITFKLALMVAKYMNYMDQM